MKKLLALLAFLLPLPALAQYDYGPPMTIPSYQGLWWNAPGGSESGWGVNITHQGNTLFATWFTYDTDGSGMWLVVPDAELINDMGMGDGYGMGMNYGPYIYNGMMYRTNGPAFDSATFNGSAVTVTEVGMASFRFTDPNFGTFTYTVNGVTGSKPITRQQFATMPSCDFSGMAGTNYQDLWWRSPAGSESGWGVNITHQGDTLFATWFTYGANGKGQWFVMSNGTKSGGSTYTGALYTTRGPSFAAAWDSSKVSVSSVGTATFNFGDPMNGTFTYTVNGVTQSKPITRQVYASPVTVCR